VPMRIKELDGVRGIAILMVILFHYGYLGFGWIGVQIFFVLSGYLITTILLRERDFTLGIYLKRFYWRRSLRIFPLYFGYLLLITVCYLLFSNPAVFGEQWLFLYTYTFNIYSTLPSYQNSFFLGHLWSLSIEEQFYLVWPLLVFVLPRASFNRVLLGLLLITPLIRFIAAWLVGAAAGERAGMTVYYLTICQIDAFATGAAIASVNLSRIQRPHKAFRLVLLATILIGLASVWWQRGVLTFETIGDAFWPGSTFALQHVWSYMLLNVISGLFVLSIVRGIRPIPLLDSRLLTYIGRISYGIYVYHFGLQGLFQPLRTAGFFSIQDMAVFLMYCATTFAAAALSFHLFENKLLNLRERPAWYVMSQSRRNDYTSPS
jgi:peptidoglycan/LPS O-acetylase OafA/YrhL